MNDKAVLRIGRLRSWMLVLVAYLAGGVVFGDTCHVWEKIEINLRAEKSYENPYTQVEVWVDLDTESDPKNPRFKLSAPAISVVQYEARMDACAWLDHLLEDSFLVGLGSYGGEIVRDYSA